jgi:hypothetical protein
MFVQEPLEIPCGEEKKASVLPRLKSPLAGAISFLSQDPGGRIKQMGPMPISDTLLGKRKKEESFYD